MQLKIYSGEQFLILTDEQNMLDNGELDCLKLRVENNHNFSIKQFVSEFSLKAFKFGIIFSEDFCLLEEKLRDEYRFIPAAGGLVLNDNKESLFIFRRGIWDLPKGKLDEGETIDACAIREVEEETGISNTLMDKFLLNTYHFYEEKGQSILKETYWYLMNSPGIQVLIPQAEEQITAIKWADADSIIEILPVTYPMIRDVFNSYKNQIN
jgi:8-oxo-dGTP pyrophosphatase MutT (NUDIX family)